METRDKPRLVGKELCSSLSKIEFNPTIAVVYTMCPAFTELHTHHHALEVRLAGRLACQLLLSKRETKFFLEEEGGKTEKAPDGREGSNHL